MTLLGDDSIDISGERTRPRSPGMTRWQKTSQNSRVDLSDKQAKAEHARLHAELLEHDKRYYQDDKPTVTDAEYDALRKRYGDIEERFPDLKTLESLTLKVGAAPTGRFAKIRHSVPMLSLDNAFSEEDVTRFADRIRRFLKLNADEPLAFTAEPKIDGLSMSLRYEQGKLVNAATRGDGTVGEDVTANIKTLKDVPQTLKGKDIPDVAEVRGEVYMGKADFLALNERQKAAGKELYVNPRNTAAGSLRQKDASITASRPLRFFAYAWGQMSEMPADTQSGMVKWLGKAGFHTNPIFKVAKSAEELLKVHEEIGLARGKLDYDIDGVVYKVDRLDWQERLGFVSRSPALGGRAQIPGRAGHHGGARHRDPGRAHRRADAGREARTGRRRRRRSCRTRRCTTRTRSRGSMCASATP